VPKKAVILLSGGLDSATCLAIAQADGFECYAMSFHYDQRHSSELEAAKCVAQAAKVQEHRVINLQDLGALKGSSLTDVELEVPDHDAAHGEGNIPNTYVPARNTVMLSYALGWAEVLAADDIFYGANAIDYSGYCDCRPEYIASFERMANLATTRAVEGAKVTIHAPLLQLTKDQIIAKGIALGVDYAQTVSCYRANAQGAACGTCDSCVHRQAGFARLGVTDPTLYAA